MNASNLPDYYLKIEFVGLDIDYDLGWIFYL
jgi:hypothetical protein